MTGSARAWGAVTILNATATGIGCSLAVQAGAEATWEWLEPDEAFTLTTGGDERIARAIAQGRPARASCLSTFPPARGLKTSSAAAAALGRAARRAQGEDLAGLDLVRDGVAACRRAGITLTGAFDDQAAVVLGGCHLTDNKADAIVAPLAVPPWHVAVWVPEHTLDKQLLRGVDWPTLAAGARAAESLALHGHVAQAMTANGALFARAYRALGLPIDVTSAQVALDHGALGAGLSGTGPAVAALFDKPVVLPPVAGGTWMWTRVAEGEA